ncbi:HNH endonuclease [Amycolatopsis sp. NPDC004378]
MGENARKPRTNRARRRQAKEYQAAHGCSYLEALRKMPPRKVTVSGDRRALARFMLRAVRCGNPRCGLPLWSGGSGSLRAMGQLAHIRALAPGGVRYDPARSRDVLENLIVLCSNCHWCIDRDEDDYPAELLQTWQRAQLADLLRESAG